MVPTSSEIFETAVQHLQSGRLNEAEPLLQEVLAMEPGHVQALSVLGGIAFERDALGPAIHYFGRACRLRPLNPQLRSYWGSACLLAGMVGQAIEHLRRALCLDPTNVQSHTCLAEALIDQGFFEEAITHIREAIRLAPQSAWSYVSLSQLVTRGRATILETEYAAIEALANRTDLRAAESAVAHFAFAAILEMRGAYDEAFHHYKSANELKIAVFRENGEVFDAEQHGRFVDSIIETFTRGFFERVHGFGIDSDVPIFVVGMARSGTTLVEQILASHPQVRGAGELATVPNLAELLPSLLGISTAFPECLANLDPATARVAAAIYLGELGATDGGAARVVDKLPQNHLYLGLIATLFPRARVISCRRDPRDVGASMYFQNFRYVSYACRLEDIAYVYGQYQRLMAHWQQCLPVSMHEVCYEELVTDQENVSRRLVAFCDLPWSDRCMSFHNTARTVQTASKLQVRQPIYQSSIGRWKQLEVHLRPLIEMLRLVDTELAGSSPEFTDK